MLRVRLDTGDKPRYDTGDWDGPTMRGVGFLVSLRLFSVLAATLFCVGCTVVPAPHDLALVSVKVVDSREHPIYAGWQKAPPITQLLEISFSSRKDLLRYAHLHLPAVHDELYECPSPGHLANRIGHFGGYFYWSDLEMNGYRYEDPGYETIRAGRRPGEPFIYRSFVEIATNEDTMYTPPELPHDLLREPKNLCLRVIFADMVAFSRRTNVIFIPQDTLIAAFLAGDLKPGTDYPGPKLP